MSGMLTVVGNPRRRRRNRRRPKAGRKHHRRRLHAKATRNPRRRRRVHARRHVRRRRHHNPILSGGVVGVVTKGLTLGLGAVAARLVANAVNNLAFKGKTPDATGLTGLPKIGLEAAVGAGGWFALKSLKQGAFANAFATGAGIVVALDIYDLYVKAMLPAMLQDYAYGNLNDYQYGALNGWAPQPGLEAGMSGGNVYDGGVY